MSASLTRISHASYADDSRIRADNMAAEAERIHVQEVNNGVLARLTRGETVDPLTLSDDEFDVLFPAAVFAAVFTDMVRAVEKHMKGAAMERPA